MKKTINLGTISLPEAIEAIQSAAWERISFTVAPEDDAAFMLWLNSQPAIPEQDTGK